MYFVFISQLEFNYAARRKTASRMIPVVMEERVRNTGTWDGEVGLVLGGRLYVDMCGDTFDDEYSEHCIDDLYAKIIKIIKNPIKGFGHSGTLTEIQSSRDPNLVPVRQKPKEKPKSNTKPLKDLSVEDVGKLLEANKLKRFVEEFALNEVDGATLMVTNSAEELKDLGISMLPKARMFHTELEKYKWHGIPFAVLGIKEVKDDKEEDNEIEDEDGGEAVLVQAVAKEKVIAPAVKYGDGTFTISGATGSHAARINGTFEISDAMQNGVPVYAKVGDPDTFIELCGGSFGWRWYIKEAKNRGNANGQSFAYAQCLDEDLKLPSESDQSMWFICANNAYTQQSTLAITPSSDFPLPANIMQLLTQARITIKAAKEERIAEVTQQHVFS